MPTGVSIHRCGCWGFCSATLSTIYWFYYNEGQAGEPQEDNLVALGQYCCRAYFSSSMFVTTGRKRWGKSFIRKAHAEIVEGMWDGESRLASFRCTSLLALKENMSRRWRYGMPPMGDIVPTL